jgi:hypothetical protein
MLTPFVFLFFPFFIPFPFLFFFLFFFWNVTPFVYLLTLNFIFWILQEPFLSGNLNICIRQPDGSYSGDSLDCPEDSLDEKLEKN